MNITARLETLPDQELLQEKGGRGFPYVTLMTSSGDVIWEFRPSDGKAFDEALTSATLLNKLMAKSMAEPENKGLAASVKILENMGRSQRKPTLSDDEMKELAKTEGLNAKVLEIYETEMKSKAEMKIFMDAFRKSREDGGVAVLELYKKGAKIPSGIRKIGIYYWATKGAIAAKDLVNGNKALADFTAEAEKDPRIMEQAKGDIETMRKELDALAAPADK